MIKFIKKRWYLLIVIIAIAGFFLYRQTIVKSQLEKEKTYVVKKETLKDTLSLSGEIEAEEKATLKFQTSGMLAGVGVKEGDYVKKYQWIASLDKNELEKNLKKYLNTFSNEKMDLDQQREDYKDKAITDAMQRVLNEAQYDLNNSIIDVEIKDIALKYANLYTPIEGIVTRIDTPYAGVNITPTTAEFEIINPKTVYFSASAEQSDVINLKKGMKAEIYLDPYSDKKINGEIYFIGFTPKTGETGTVYEVKLKIDDDNSNYQYKLGMTGDVDFTLSEKAGAIVVPTSFIKSENGNKYVWRLENGQRKKIIVTVGEEINSDTEIISGLQEGDIIYD